MHFCGFSVLQPCLGEATDTCRNQDVLHIGQVPPANDCYISLMGLDIHKNSSYKWWRYKTNFTVSTSSFFDM